MAAVGIIFWLEVESGGATRLEAGDAVELGGLPKMPLLPWTAGRTRFNLGVGEPDLQ